MPRLPRSLSRVIHPGAVSRTTAQVAVKAGLAAALAVWIGDLIGLTDPYWAGISAVVVMSATLGASFGAALSRTLATVTGLLVAVAAVEIFGQGYVVAGVVVALVLVLLPFVGLSLGARLGAATSLLVTIVPGSDVLSTAFARGANVPLGCVIAIAIGALLWPSRAGRQLEERLEADVGAASESVASSLRAIADGRPPQASPLGPGGGPERAALLRDALRERLGARDGGPAGAPARQVATVNELVGEAMELRLLAGDVEGDRARELLAEELRLVAGTVLEISTAYRARDRATLALARGNAGEAFVRLGASFDEHRATRRTAGYDTEELAGLLAVVRQIRAILRLYDGLAGG